MTSSDLKDKPQFAAGDNTGDDPLSHLHKMSTTAGLGSGDYVAVNGTAVFAGILALASGFALMSEVLLVIPLVGIIAAVIAWRQINRSNGTQTGKGLVALAIVLSLGFGGFVFAREMADTLRTRADRQAINRLVDEFSQRIKSGDNAGAYAMFDDRFHQQVPREKFDTEFNTLRQNQVFGKLTGITSNGLMQFQRDESSGTVYSATGITFQFEKGNGFRENPVFRKTADKWQFDQMPDVFPPERPRPGASGAAPPG